MGLHYMQYFDLIDDKSSDCGEQFVNDADSVASDLTEEEIGDETEIYTVEQLMVEHLYSFVENNRTLVTFITEFIDIFNEFMGNP